MLHLQHRHPCVKPKPNASLRRPFFQLTTWFLELWEWLVGNTWIILDHLGSLVTPWHTLSPYKSLRFLGQAGSTGSTHPGPRRDSHRRGGEGLLRGGGFVESRCWAKRAKRQGVHGNGGGTAMVLAVEILFKIWYMDINDYQWRLEWEKHFLTPRQECGPELVYD